MLTKQFIHFYAIASVWVAVPLLVVSTALYIQHAVLRPATEMFPIGLSAFGVTAALSGISFSMARAFENSATAKYAGEKFLHSAILLIQGLMILYIRDDVYEFDWVKARPNLLTGVKLSAGVLSGCIASAASWAWYFAYAELNDELWQNWRQRTIADLKDKGTR